MQLHDLFERVAADQFPDQRTTVARLHLDAQNGSAYVHGDILDRAAATTLLEELRTHAPHIDWHDHTTPLVNGPQHGWAVVDRAVVDVRRMPDHGAERVTQAVYGEACELLQRENDWAWVRTADGYLGWTHTEPLHPVDAEAARSWREQCTHVVATPFAPVFADAACHSVDQQALLPFGAPVFVAEQRSDAGCVEYPGGQQGWINTQHLLSRGDVPHARAGAWAWITRCIPSLIGTPYLWGGKTPWGYDCSGLTQTLYTMLGLPLPRDADQQYAAGDAVSVDDLQCGDLLFFDTDAALEQLPTSPTSITHVVFALDHRTFVHASRRYGGVVRGSLDPQSPHFVPDYERRFIGARRYVAQ